MSLQSHSSGLLYRMASDRVYIYSGRQISPVLVLQNESINDSILDKGVIHYQEFDRSLCQLVRRVHGAQPKDLARRHVHYRFPSSSVHSVQLPDGILRVRLDLVARVQQTRYVSLVLEYEPDDFVTDSYRIEVPAPQSHVADIFSHVLKFIDDIGIKPVVRA